MRAALPLLPLLLQGSLLVSPVYTGAEPPEGRAMRGILVIHAAAPGAPRGVTRTREEALELAKSLHGRLLSGEDFAELSRSSSSHASARYGGVLGTVWPGMFHPALDAFLFSAEVGELSEPIESPAGFHLVQRIERDAACRVIQVDGVDERARERCRELLDRLEAGADFAELAAQESDDPVSAARGGAAAIYQRGPRDTLLKAAAFSIPVGEVAGPIETPFALFVIRRVPPAELDPALAEDLVARGRAILLSFAGAVGADKAQSRAPKEAEDLAHELAERIAKGEDMSVLAREWSDDPGSRPRGGDLGWIRRYTSDTPAFVDKLFQHPLGELIGPLSSNAGWVILRRER